MIAYSFLFLNQLTLLCHKKWHMICSRDDNLKTPRRLTTIFKTQIPATAFQEQSLFARSCLFYHYLSNPFWWVVSHPGCVNTHQSTPVSCSGPPFSNRPGPLACSAVSVRVPLAAPDVPAPSGPSVVSRPSAHSAVFIDVSRRMMLRPLQIPPPFYRPEAKSNWMSMLTMCIFGKRVGEEAVITGQYGFFRFVQMEKRAWYAV